MAKTPQDTPPDMPPAAAPARGLGRRHLKQQPRRYEDVPTPEFGAGTFVRLGVMRYAEREAWADASVDTVTVEKDGKPTEERRTSRNFIADTLARCILDPETNEPAFDASKPADLTELKGMDAQVGDRLFTAALLLNGAGKAGQQAQEDRLKNSPAAAT